MTQEEFSLEEIGAFMGKPPAITDETFFHVGVSGGKDSAAALLWMVHRSGFARERILELWG